MAAGVAQVLPRGLDLADLGHVRHRAAGGEVGKDHGGRVGREDVGGLGHEVHAAEHDVRRAVGGGVARQLEAVAADVGELDDLVALVVVAQDVHRVAEGGAGGAGALDQRRVGGIRYDAGADDAPLGVGIGAPAEQEQGRRRRGVRERRGGGGLRHGRILTDFVSIRH